MSNSHTVTLRSPADLAAEEAAARVPREPLGRLFLRFLKFGCLAWGGTTIALIIVSIDSVSTVLVFGISPAALFYFKSKFVIPLVVAGAAMAGYLLNWIAV